MPDIPTLEDDRKSKRRLNVRSLPIIVGGFALLYGLTGYRGWLIFLIGTAGVWLLAAIWVFSLERGLKVERKIHLAWASVGDSVPEELKLTNTSWLPALWVELSDSTVSLARPLKIVSDVEGRFTRTRHFNHLFNHRGLYTLGPTRLRTGDPFGIYSLTLNHQHTDTILVTPPMIPLEQLRIPSGGWAGDQTRQRAGLEREISEAGTRPYLPGDSLKRIHWSASAHQDRLIVRRLDPAASQDYWVYVDLEQSAQAGAGRESTLELAIVLAASVTMRAIRERRRVGLVLAGPNLVRLAPRSDPTHIWQIFRALATAQTGQRSLAELLSLSRSSQAAAILLITPFIDPAWVAKLGAREAGKHVRVLWINPAEFGGRANQDQALASLSRVGIPFQRMPKSLLDQAYASRGRTAPPWLAPAETGNRFVRQRETTWQSMN